MDERAVLVVGGSGSTGRRVCAELTGAGHAVRSVSRSGRVPFDWADPSTWDHAVDGARAAYVMAPDGVWVDPAFLERAVELGVERVVLLSSDAVEQMGDERLLAAEEAVRSLVPEWTVLRPDWFDQNFDEGVLAEQVRAGAVTVPVEGVRQAFVHAGDIAAVAAAALTGGGFGGRTLRVTGPRALSFAEAVGLIAEQAGFEVRFEGAAKDFVRVLTQAGVPGGEIDRMLASFAALVERGDAVPSGVVEQVTGRAAVDFADFVVEAAPAWRV